MLFKMTKFIQTLDLNNAKRMKIKVSKLVFFSNSSHGMDVEWCKKRTPVDQESFSLRLIR